MDNLVLILKGNQALSPEELRPKHTDSNPIERSFIQVREIFGMGSPLGNYGRRR